MTTTINNEHKTQCPQISRFPEFRGVGEVHIGGCYEFFNNSCKLFGIE